MRPYQATGLPHLLLRHGRRFYGAAAVALWQSEVQGCIPNGCAQVPVHGQVCEGLPSGEYEIKSAGPEDIEVHTCDSILQHFVLHAPALSRLLRIHRLTVCAPCRKWWCTQWHCRRGPPTRMFHQSWQRNQPRRRVAFLASLQAFSVALEVNLN